MWRPRWFETTLHIGPAYLGRGGICMLLGLGLKKKVAFEVISFNRHGTRFQPCASCMDSKPTIERQP